MRRTLVVEVLVRLRVVSVVLVAHDRPEYLAQAVRSMYKQDAREWEIVVIDVSKTPLSGVVDAEMRGKPYLYRHLPEMNGWPPRCSVLWNLGVRMSSGEYVAFLDDDDTKADTFVTGMRSLLEGRPGFDFAVCRGWTMDRDGKMVAPFMGMPFVDAVRLKYGEFLVTGQILVRRSAFDAMGGFDEQLPVAEDYEFAFRLLQRKGIAVGHVLFNHRNHADCASQSPRACPDTQVALRYIIQKHGLAELKCRGCGAPDTGISYFMVEMVPRSGWSLVCGACKGAGK